MDSKTQQMKIIKNWGDAKDGEDVALNEVKVQIEGFTPNKPNPRCCVAKNLLQWRRQNPKKSVLITVGCMMFVFGITSFVIMHEMLGRNIPKSFLNMTESFDMDNQDIVLNQNSPLHLALNGHWVEDFDQRDNMDSYLKEMGMSWFKRSYASSVSWEDELLLLVKGDTFVMNGLRGPFAEAYEYRAMLDNQTINKMDIGDFGGIVNAISEITDDYMRSYAYKPGSSTELFFTVTLTMDMQDVNTLKVQYRHVDSNVVWTEIFKRTSINKEDKNNVTNDQSEVEKEEEEYDPFEDEDPFGDSDDWK